MGVGVPFVKNKLPDPDEVAEQLNRLVNHRSLCQSRRLVVFLRYIVERTMHGEGDQLKERNVGTEVFGKGSRYDPAIDSTVRVAASELRKRLALYYQEPEHARELRFSLPLGTYTLSFQWPPAEDSKDFLEQQAVVISPPTPPPASDITEHPQPRARRLPWLWAGVTTLLLAMFGSLFLVRGGTFSDRTIDLFWGPLLHTNSPVLVLVAGHSYSTMSIRDAQNPTRIQTLDMSSEDGINTVTFDDMKSLIIITSFLSVHHVPYEVRDESTVTISDLRKGPVVLIGAFCNSWALRLLKPMRFHFANDPGMINYWIEDSESKEKPKWIVNRPKQLATNDFVDYAIVGRYKDNNLGQPVIVVSGISGGNNINAAEMITKPSFLSGLFSSLSSGKADRNFEAVISAESINGHVSQPHIEASYSW